MSRFLSPWCLYPWKEVWNPPSTGQWNVALQNDSQNIQCRERYMKTLVSTQYLEIKSISGKDAGTCFLQSYLMRFTAVFWEMTRKDSEEDITYCFLMTRIWKTCGNPSSGWKAWHFLLTAPKSHHSILQKLWKCSLHRRGKYSGPDWEQERAGHSVAERLMATALPDGGSPGSSPKINCRK